MLVFRSNKFTLLLNSILMLSVMSSCTSVEPESNGEQSEKPQEQTLVPVTGISLDSNTLVLDEGQSFTLKATVVPSNATNQKLLWTSGDPNVATVVDGLVTAVKAGKTAISATTEDGGLTAICMVTVKPRIIPTIILSKSSLDLTVGDMVTLTATVGPDELIDKTVTWTSSDVNVAVVDNNGRVIAVGAGVATVKASANGGEGVFASCHVNVKEGGLDPSIVDLGLSVYWASCNLGASSPEEYGDFFAWGETETKDKTNFTEENYKWWYYNNYNGYSKKYNTSASSGPLDNKTVLDLEDDVAYCTMRGKWRMPTEDEWKELISNCTWTWTKLKGVDGCKVVSRINGNSIFLPCTGLGYEDDKESDSNGYSGQYWSSSSLTGAYFPQATCLFCSFSPPQMITRDRYAGLSVRAVYGESSIYTIIMNRALNLFEGDIYTINPIVSPTYANQSIYWEIDDNTVASVSTSGMVTALKVGTATITATCGGKKAYCKVTIAPIIKSAVDLDLPSGVKWATCNLGAASPEEAGFFYAWGEIAPKDDYGWFSYKWGYPFFGEQFLKYNEVDNLVILQPEDNVVSIKMGGRWRIPTSDELYELMTCCNWTWTTLNGISGYQVSSKKTSSNIIFLPAAGVIVGSGNSNDNSYMSLSGHYQSINLRNKASQYACVLDFTAESIGFLNGFSRDNGIPIRPVYEEPNP